MLFCSPATLSPGGWQWQKPDDTNQEEKILARFEALMERMAAYNIEFTDEEVEADVEAARSELDVDSRS